jgi:hypothetical protein
MNMVKTWQRFWRRAIAVLLAVMIAICGVTGMPGEAWAATTSIFYPNSDPNDYLGNGTTGCVNRNDSLYSYVAGGAGIPRVSGSDHTIFYTDLTSSNLSLSNLNQRDGRFDRFSVTLNPQVSLIAKFASGRIRKNFVYNPDKPSQEAYFFPDLGLGEAGRIRVIYQSQRIESFTMEFRGTVVTKRYGKMPIVNKNNQQVFSISCVTAP